MKLVAGSIKRLVNSMTNHVRKQRRRKQIKAQVKRTEVAAAHLQEVPFIERDVRCCCGVLYAMIKFV